MQQTQILTFTVNLPMEVFFSQNLDSVLYLGSVSIDLIIYFSHITELDKSGTTEHSLS